MRALRVLMPVVVAAVLLAGMPAGPAVVSASNERAAVLDFARSQIGKPWVYGATGPNSYDCSGFVYRAFQATGLLDRVGGKRRTARGFFNWFAERGRITKNPQPGDLAVWGDPVKHIGIYSGVRDGHPMAVSTLTSGVKEHRVHGLTSKLRAYLRVDLDVDGGGGGDDGSGGGSVAEVQGSNASVLPSPSTNTITLRPGSHTLYRLGATGNVLEQRTIRRSRSITVGVDPDIEAFGGQAHARITSGKWAGWWRRVPDSGPSCCMYGFPGTRTLRLAAGTHLFKTFHAGNTVVLRDHIRVDRPTYLNVDYRASFNGKRHFLIADGPMAGSWVAKTASSRLVP